MRFFSTPLPWAALLICAFCGVACGDEGAFDKMKQLVRKRFPQVAQLSTAELAARLQNRSRVQPILLDEARRAVVQ